MNSNKKNQFNSIQIMHWISQKFQTLTQYLSFSHLLNPKSIMNKQFPKNQMCFKTLSSHRLYQTKIKPLLKQLSTGTLNTNQVIKKLKLFESYSNIFKNQRNIDFNQLKNYKQNLAPLFAKMAQFVLDHEEKINQKKIKLLLQQQNEQLELQKEDILYLMSLMALNLIPHQEHHNQIKYLPLSQKIKFPYPYDFSHVFSEEQFKTKTIIEYFKQHLNESDWKSRNQKFIIKRKFLKTKIEELIKSLQKKQMTTYEIRSDTESIQDFTGHVKVDFANKFIGGGALVHGCVQQQIMFATHPELFTSVLFCEAMNDNQTIFFSGFRKYFKNKGYGWTTKYDGPQIINEDTFKKNQYIVAIDALHFPTNKDLTQFKKDKINRQILKAYVGFQDLPQKTNIVTGNWGCGAFNGDVRLKFLIQWMACSLAQKHMIYCPFGHRQKIIQNQSILKQLENKTIGQVYHSIIKAGENMNKSDQNIFQKINKSFSKKYTLESCWKGRKIIHLD